MKRKNLPQRTSKHILETESEKFLLNYIPNSWTYEKKSFDYGTDYEIEIFKDGFSTGKKLLVQLKAHKNVKEFNSVISQVLKTSTINYFMSLDIDTILFVYASNKRTLYLLFMKSFVNFFLDVLNPNWKQQKSVTVRIPVNWNLEFRYKSDNHIQVITDYLIDEKKKKIIDEKQTILLSASLRNKKGNSILLKKLKESSNDQIILAILNCKYFLSNEPRVRELLLSYLNHDNFSIIIKSVYALKYHPSKTATEKLLDTYEKVYQHNYKIDKEEFKEVVSNLIDALDASKDYENRKVLNTLLIEFYAPLRNWTGQKAGKALLSWWDSLTNDTQEYAYKKIVDSKNDIIHSFTDMGSAKAIISYVINFDYEYSFK